MAKYSLQHLEPEVSLVYLADVYDREGYEFEADCDRKAKKIAIKLQVSDDDKALKIIKSMTGHASGEAFKEYEGAPSYPSSVHRWDDEEEDWVKVEY